VRKSSKVFSREGSSPGSGRLHRVGSGTGTYMVLRRGRKGTPRRAGGRFTFI